MKMNKLRIISTVAALAAVLTVTCGFATSAATDREPTVETSYVEAAIPTKTNDGAEQKHYLRYIFDDDSISEVSEEAFQSVFNKASEQHMLYYYFHNDNIYELSKKQFDEVAEKNNMDEVVQRDALTPVEQSENRQASDYGKIENTNLSGSRAAGSWTISNELGAGVQMNYFMPDGGQFVVDDGEELMYSIEPNRACYLSVGAYGSRYFMIGPRYIDRKSNYGITLGTRNPGSFNFFVINENDFDIYVKGSVDIY